MTGPDSTTARAFAWRATLVALLGGAAAAALAAGRPPADRVWVLLGWGVLAVAGTLGGAWLASEHGKPGSGFLVALGAGVAARFRAALPWYFLAVFWLSAAHPFWAFLAQQMGASAPAVSLYLSPFWGAVADRSAPAWVQAALYGLGGLGLLAATPRKAAA